jgi:beta-alanine degradation protein BauB
MAEVGTKLIFENERIKVWEFTLAPGETIATHRHERDYFFYPIEGGTLEVTRETGTVQAMLEVGKVYYRGKGDSHAARNIGPDRYHEILVELKG